LSLTPPSPLPDRPQQFDHQWRRDAVEDFAARTAVPDHAAPAEQHEVVRRGRPGQPRDGGQFAGARLPLPPDEE